MVAFGRADSFVAQMARRWSHNAVAAQGWLRLAHGADREGYGRANPHRLVQRPWPAMTVLRQRVLVLVLIGRGRWNLV